MHGNMDVTSAKERQVLPFTNVAQILRTQLYAPFFTIILSFWLLQEALYDHDVPQCRRISMTLDSKETRKKKPSFGHTEELENTTQPRT
jgi:hypothetical protein